MNSIGAEGAVAIGAALQHNTSLRKLDLGNNDIGDDGAVSIGTGLQHNTSLHTLILCTNRIGHGGRQRSLWRFSTTPRSKR
jgi:hypothetical protein